MADNIKWTPWKSSERSAQLKHSAWIKVRSEGNRTLIQPTGNSQEARWIFNNQILGDQ